MLEDTANLKKLFENTPRRLKEAKTETKDNQYILNIFSKPKIKQKNSKMDIFIHSLAFCYRMFQFLSRRLYLPDTPGWSTCAWISCRAARHAAPRRSRARPRPAAAPPLSASPGRRTRPAAQSWRDPHPARSTDRQHHLRLRCRLHRRRYRHHRRRCSLNNNKSFTDHHLHPPVLNKRN
jgi:hypothetical protein